MQRKLGKQLGKVTQWTNEKVFSGEKTQLSGDFTAFEREIEVRKTGIERLHATSLPYFHQITKVKPTADPLPPSGSGKEKILHTEALGLVMIDYGNTLGGGYGDALSMYGRARCKLASVQEDYGSRLSEGYIGGMEQALGAVNEYKAMRKKLDSRRLALDSAISGLNKTKKDSKAAQMEMEVENAQARFSEMEEETHARMRALEETEEQQYIDLCDLLEAELDYFSRCKEILEELKEQWPSGDTGRPRAKSASSFVRAPPRPAKADDTPNRSRSQSNASSKGKEKRSILPSFGSFGKKSGLSSAAKKGFRGDRLEDDQSEEELFERPPPVRRLTTPNPGVKYMKMLYDFAGDAADELPLRTGQIIEVKQEVSEDWWIGECEGRSGLFPKAYAEEYVPTPRTAVPRPVHTQSFDDSDDDFSDHASLSAQAQPAPVRAPVRKPAPPPPPSRRSQSSTNLPNLAPPIRPDFRPRASTLSRTLRLDSSPEASPFAHSEDDDYFDHPAGPVCKDCGCDDFVQNVFKPNGTCSTCFHQH